MISQALNTNKTLFGPYCSTVLLHSSYLRRRYCLPNVFPPYNMMDTWFTRYRHLFTDLETTRGYFNKRPYWMPNKRKRPDK